MAGKKKVKPRKIGSRESAPRDGQLLRASGDVGGDCNVWYYTNPKTLDVVVDVLTPSGDFLGTVTVRVKR